MRRKLFFISLFSIFLCISPYLRAQNAIQDRKDSLRRVINQTEGEEKLKTYNLLGGLYVQEAYKENGVDSAFAILDEMEAEARRQNNVFYQGITRINKLTSLFNSGPTSYDKIIQMSPAILEFLSENNLLWLYYQAHITLTNTYRLKGETEQALKEAEMIYEHAKERQHAGGMGLVLSAMARIYTGQSRFSDAEACLRESIGLLKDSTNYIGNLATIYFQLGNSLIAQSRYDDALQIAAENEEINRRYEEISKSPQLIAWMNLWGVYMRAYLESEQYDKAEVYLDKIDSATNGSRNLYGDRAQILYGKKQYQEALEMVDKAIEATTINKLQHKGMKMMILIEMGEAEAAYDLFNEIVVDIEAEHNEDFSVQLDEIRTQYEVEKHIAEKERNRNYFLFALSGCVLLIILLGGLFYYNRAISVKNRGLYKQIKEQDRLANKLMVLLNKTEQPDTDEAMASFIGSRQQRELIARLQKYLRTDKNFIKAEINRDELVAALGTNKNILSDAIRVVTGKTLMEYIRNMQLEEARHMLENHPELTIEAIAADCGFNAPNTFYRLFQKNYEISPAEYRKIAGLVER